MNLRSIFVAVIGTFVLGLGDQVQSTAPQAQFTFDFTDNAAGSADVLAITHDGGDAIPSDRLSIGASGVVAEDTGGNSYDAAVRGNNDTWTNIAGSSSTVSAGSTTTIGSAAFNESGTTTTLPNDKDNANGVEEVDFDAATIRMVWSSEGGDTSATLGKWDGSDA
jgi:FlaG/FlaF family flagellin (archaellin)